MDGTQQQQNGNSLTPISLRMHTHTLPVCARLELHGNLVNLLDLYALRFCAMLKVQAENGKCATFAVQKNPASRWTRQMSVYCDSNEIHFAPTLLINVEFGCCCVVVVASFHAQLVSILVFTCLHSLPHSLWRCLHLRGGVLYLISRNGSAKRVFPHNKTAVRLLEWWTNGHSLMPHSPYSHTFHGILTHLPILSHKHTDNAWE